MDIASRLACLGGHLSTTRVVAVLVAAGVLVVALFAIAALIVGLPLPASEVLVSAPFRW
jgi:hypothetical protein